MPTESTCLKYSALCGYSHWLLRLPLAGVFLFHGIGKFPNLDGMSQMLNLPVFIVLLVAFTEVMGGAGLIVSGFLKNKLGDIVTRLSALALIPVMIGAILMVHWGQWSFVASETHPMGGMEFQVTLLAVLLYLLIKGKSA